MFHMKYSTVPAFCLAAFPLSDLNHSDVVSAGERALTGSDVNTGSPCLSHRNLLCNQMQILTVFLHNWLTPSHTQCDVDIIQLSLIDILATFYRPTSIQILLLIFLYIMRSTVLSYIQITEAMFVTQQCCIQSTTCQCPEWNLTVFSIVLTELGGQHGQNITFFNGQLQNTVEKHFWVQPTPT